MRTTTRARTGGDAPKTASKPAVTWVLVADRARARILVPQAVGGALDEIECLVNPEARMPDRAILGWTHYELVADLFKAALPAGTPLIHQPDATADALQGYLARHPELDPGRGGARRFLTTGAPGPQSALVEAFWGGPVSFEAA